MKVEVCPIEMKINSKHVFKNIFIVYIFGHLPPCADLFHTNAMLIKFTGREYHQINSTIISLHYATELELHAFIIPISTAGILSHQRGYSSRHQTV